MSHPSPGNLQNPAANQQVSSQALLDELRVAADRARDERLKLARMVKHTESLPILGSAPEPAVVSERIVSLSEQVERLDRAVTEKLQALDQVQRDIESRTQYLESLRHTITDTTRAFVTQVEQAQHFKAHVDAAKQHVRMTAGRVVEDVREHLGSFEKPIADRIRQLNEMDEQIDKRIARMQQMHKQANDAVDKHLLAALRSAKEQAADMTAPMKAEIDKYLIAQRAIVEAAIHKKIAELDVDVEEALRPLTSRFDQIVADAQAQADLLAETTPDRLEQAMNQQLEVARAKLAEQAAGLVAGIDEKTLAKAEKLIHEKIAMALDSYLTDAEEQAGGYVDGLITKLDHARHEALELFRKDATQFEATCRVDREQALAKLDHEISQVQRLAEDRVQKARQIIEQAADGIHARAANSVEQALRNADKKLEEFEAAAVDHLRAIDDGIEHGIETSRKLINEHEKQARKQGDEANRIVESAIAAAEQRLSGFEAGITQRIGLATQSADEAIGSVDARLERLERDAAARVMQIIELAEQSGSAIADSIQELSSKAQATAVQAQEDLDEKLRAFEHISAQALRTAEDTLRDNIGELRDSSRAMIEMVSRQVKAQAAEIEPQTREVITQAEQSMRRRLGELRDAAQSMVDIAVTRLERQLDEVKSRAQRTAFEGIDPTSDAA